MELYKTFRPKLFKHIYGQTQTLTLLKSFFDKDKFPHATLFVGPSGCGKTTAARIAAKKLGCVGRDVNEINCADFRGIDTIRDIRGHLGHAPIAGTSRCWIIDEAHQLGSPAQNALLKILEDTPSHIYFMLATTDPAKLLKTIRTRCTDLRFKSLDHASMEAMLADVCKRAKIKLVIDDLKQKIIEIADGSARKALVLMDSIRDITDEEEALDILRSSDTERQAHELAFGMLYKRHDWPTVAKMIKEIDEEPETIRRIVLTFCANEALKGGGLAKRALAMIDCFSQNYYDTGKAGLVWSCYHVCNMGHK